MLERVELARVEAEAFGFGESLGRGGAVLGLQMGAGELEEARRYERFLRRFFQVADSGTNLIAGEIHCSACVEREPCFQA